MLLPTGYLITHWACYPTGYIIPSDILSQQASHHVPSILLCIRHLITHRASYHLLGILLHQAYHFVKHIIPKHLITYQTYHSTGHLITQQACHHPPSMSSHQVCQMTKSLVGIGIEVCLIRLG